MASTTKPCGYTARANVECGYPKNDTEIWQDVAGVARRFCWRRVVVRFWGRTSITVCLLFGFGVFLMIQFVFASGPASRGLAHRHMKSA
jgi:hypothetical protein